MPPPLLPMMEVISPSLMSKLRSFMARTSRTSPVLTRQFLLYRPLTWMRGWVSDLAARGMASPMPARKRFNIGAGLPSATISPPSIHTSLSAR